MFMLKLNSKSKTEILLMILCVAYVFANEHYRKASFFHIYSFVFRKARINIITVQFYYIK